MTKLSTALRAAGITREAFAPQAKQAPRVHRVKQCFTKVQPLDPKCAMKTRTRKIGFEAIDMGCVLGYGRFDTPIKATRRI